MSGIVGGSSGTAFGIADFNDVARYGLISQTASFLDNQVTGVSAGSFAAGIVQQNEVGEDGTLRQATTLDGNTVTNVSGGVAVGIGIARRNGDDAGHRGARASGTSRAHSTVSGAADA